MAKGNDGNYLQHCTEVEAAISLARMNNENRSLHIALAHGMAPFEPFEISLNQPQPGLCRRLLKCKLIESKKSPQSGEPVIVDAYRKTKASEECYPNSAELLRAVVGTTNLSGGITEIDGEKYMQLANAWSHSRVKTACSSWREEILPDGILACPENLQTPWLFTMDPMTYIEENYEKDDNNLRRFDIGILSYALSRYFRSGKPGIASLFVYKVGKNNGDVQSQFREFVEDLRDSLSGYSEVGVSYYSLPHMWGNRNLAGLLHSPQIDLSTCLTSAGLTTGIAPDEDLD